MVHRTFRFYLLDKERFRESRDISQNRTLLDGSKSTARRQPADIQSKLEELQQLNQATTDRKKMKAQEALVKLY
jgi:hypothetical protein